VRALEAPPLNPRPWLFAVALNLARDEGRSRVRQGHKLELLKGERSGDAVPPPDEQVETDERAAAVHSALAQLTEQDRAVLLMKAEGLSYEEIATATGLAKGAIGTTLARARKRLVESYRSLERNDVAR